MEASVDINRFVPPWWWDGMSASTASNVGQCSRQGALPYSQLPPSWWKEKFLESFQPCFSRLAGTELLCSSALVCGAALTEPVQRGHGIMLHIGGICKVCLPFSNFPYRCLLCSLVSCFYSCFLWKFSGFYWWVIFCLLSEPQFGYNMMIRVTFCENCDVHLLETWSDPHTKNFRTLPETAPYELLSFQFQHTSNFFIELLTESWLSPVTSFCSLIWKVLVFMWLCFVIIKYSTSDSDPLRSRDILGLPASFIHNVTIRECCYCFFISVLHLLI